MMTVRLSQKDDMLLINGLLVETIDVVGVCEVVNCKVLSGTKRA